MNARLFIRLTVNERTRLKLKKENKTDEVACFGTFAGIIIHQSLAVILKIFYKEYKNYSTFFFATTSKMAIHLSNEWIGR